MFAYGFYGKGSANSLNSILFVGQLLGLIILIWDMGRQTTGSKIDIGRTSRTTWNGGSVIIGGGFLLIVKRQDTVIWIGSGKVITIELLNSFVGGSLRTIKSIYSITVLSVYHKLTMVGVKSVSLFSNVHKLVTILPFGHGFRSAT